MKMKLTGGAAIESKERALCKYVLEELQVAVEHLKEIQSRVSEGSIHNLATHAHKHVCDAITAILTQE
ncbi:MAG: hypothetical protein MN733_27520 [Nitrososphaera sp.]|nr:hypothetical protein [Nitrososphaera sp.]